MRKFMDWFSEWHTVVTVIVLGLLLLSATLYGGKMNDDIFLQVDPVSIKYRQCESCGEMVPHWLGIDIGITLNPPSLTYSKSETAKAVQEAMFPYEVRSYFICMKCILEKLGVKPK